MVGMISMCSCRGVLLSMLVVRIMSLLMLLV